MIFVESREQGGDYGETGLPSRNLPRQKDKEGGREGNVLAFPLWPQSGEGGRGWDGEHQEFGGELKMLNVISLPVLINYSVH